MQIIAAIIGMFRKAPAPVAPSARRPHIRITYWSFDAVIGYYDANGRKRTMRRVAFADVARLKAAAVARGYYAC